MVSLPLWSQALVVDDARRSWGPRGHERPRWPSVWSTRTSKDSPGTRSKGIDCLALRGRPGGCSCVEETVLLLAEVVKAYKTRSGDALDFGPSPHSGGVHRKGPRRRHRECPTHSHRRRLIRRKAEFG